VSDAWIRALPSNVPSGGYFTLSNDSDRRVVLTGASSPACGMLMLHRTETAGGVASMADVPSISIAGGEHVSFAPGGYHLMCMDPTPAIRPGNSVAITLEFGGGAKVTANFKVRSATGR
jgi:periplasmic copper chaperone A